MRRLLIPSLAVMVTVGACSQREPDALVLVKGGAFVNKECTNYYGTRVAIPSFYIGKFEVTQKEWTEVMGSNPSQFKGDNLPVETVSWYDCVEYCNTRSIKEGFKPYYNIDRNSKDVNNRTEVDEIKWTVTINPGANGYRLPTEAEWEYAAGGGQVSRGYSYSGGNDVDQVSWYWRNSGDKNLAGEWLWPVIESNHCRTRPVGGKGLNELGLCDMSGNVREWCWDWYGNLNNDGTGPKGSSSETGRVWRGGGWMGGDFCCALSFRGNFEASGKGPDQGLRVCRSQ